MVTNVQALYQRVKTRLACTVPCYFCIDKRRKGIQLERRVSIPSPAHCLQNAEMDTNGVQTGSLETHTTLDCTPRVVTLIASYSRRHHTTQLSFTNHVTVTIQAGRPGLHHGRRTGLAIGETVCRYAGDPARASDQCHIYGIQPCIDKRRRHNQLSGNVQCRLACALQLLRRCRSDPTDNFVRGVRP